MSTIAETPTLAAPGPLARPVVARQIVQLGGDPRRDVARLLAAGRASTRGPIGLVWNALQAHLDYFQTWLIDQRLEGGGGLLFTIFDGFASSWTTSSPG